MLDGMMVLGLLLMISGFILTGVALFFYATHPRGRHRGDSKGSTW